MYKSPINLITEQMKTELVNELDGAVYTAIQRYGVQIDRDELLKALRYDRDQYEKGYRDGLAEANEWFSVHDKLPENNEDVLVYGYALVSTYLHYGKEIPIYAVGVYRSKDRSWYFASLDDKVVEVAVRKWRRLPAVPKED